MSCAHYPIAQLPYTPGRIPTLGTLPNYEHAHFEEGQHNLSENLFLDLRSLVLDVHVAKVETYSARAFLLEDDLFAIRHLDLHIALQADRQHAIHPATHKERDDGPNEDEHSNAKGNEENRHEDEESDANPEDREDDCGEKGESGSRQREGYEEAERKSGKEDLRNYESLQKQGVSRSNGP